MMDFKPDGTITIDLDDDGDLLILKRPKYNQLKRFRLLQSEMNENVEKARAELVPEKPADDADDDTKTAYTKAIAEATQSLEDVAAGLIFAWWRLVILGDEQTKGLGSRGLPSDDDLPYYMVGGVVRDDEGLVVATILQKVIDHWRTVPLDRGAMGRPTPIR